MEAKKKLTVILVTFVAITWFMFSFGVVRYDMPSLSFNWVDVRARLFGLHPKHEPLDLEDVPEIKIDKLLGGLLTSGFDDASCLSRYNSALFRKASGHHPSSALISKLRSYEALHNRCGPGTESYRKATEQLKSGKKSGPSDCKYVIWIPYFGLGNRIITLTSAFLYALLTNRVLLADRGQDMEYLFCEPFPESSWLLPKDFPIPDYEIRYFSQKSNQTYGNMLKTNVFNNTSDETIPSSLYLFLGHEFDDQDKLFFCDQEQSFLQQVPWLIIKTDCYYVPSLFLIPSFQQELSNLFPEKETVFHFLGRYLFHPTNQVWGMITRFYEAYLENAQEKIGVQIRVLDSGPEPLNYVFDQVLNCLLKEGILPEITKQEHTISPTRKHKTKAVLVTSLNSGYFEQLKDMYWESSTTTGEVISFFQPSHEQVEKNLNKSHDMKAWAEIYLLSLTDKLVTSSWSTFGYVAQGLGGLKPYILYKPENRMAPNPSCHRGVSLEPCYHVPPNLDCKNRNWIFSGSIVPYVKPCEDRSWGIKLFDIET